MMAKFFVQRMSVLFLLFVLGVSSHSPPHHRYSPAVITFLEHLINGNDDSPTENSCSANSKSKSLFGSTNLHPLRRQFQSAFDLAGNHKLLSREHNWKGNHLQNYNRNERRKREITRYPGDDDDVDVSSYPNANDIEPVHHKRDIQHPEISVPLNIADDEIGMARFLLALNVAPESMESNRAPRDKVVSKRHASARWDNRRYLYNPIDGDNVYLSSAGSKRNALSTFKRKKFKSHQTQFIPSISVGAMTNLGDFFDELKSNVDIMERGSLSNDAEQLLGGDHPITSLREDVDSGDESRPTGTAAFLHAFRTYRPSQKIRSLISMTPDGYHGSQFLDPNYYTIGLGK